MTSTTPTHIGYILDGNRRWARAQGLAVFRGHARGKEVLREIVHETFSAGVEFITVYAFSTENWRRSQTEVSYLMKAIVDALGEYLDEFIENKVKIVVLGEREGLPDDVIASIENAEKETAQFTGKTFGICINYGGQTEITSAVKAIVASGTAADEVTPELIAEHLYAPEIPPCDLIVRTSGEQRLSNFMLWRSAYSELLFVKKNWPDMTKDDVRDILEEYAKRERREGK